jgi:hypothetical protein
MRVEQVVPVAPAVELASVLAPLTSRDTPSLAPFSEEAVTYCDAVSRAILRTPQARRDPALVALAYWMRKAEVRRLAGEFAALETSETVLLPRGLVFHVPPTNVDTMFVYSFVLSLLLGNRNVIRVSPRRSAQTDLLCSILGRTLADARFTTVRETTRIISYGHQREISTALSLAADVRMIWGGDETISAIRRLPAKPGGMDLAFADRYSLAAIDAPTYLTADDESRGALAHQLFNDAYWFDQMACSSPRLVVWTGDSHQADEASPDLWRRVQREIDAHAYALPTGAVTAKLGYLFGAAIDRPVVRCRQYSNELSVLRLSDLEQLDRAHPGAGTFLEASVGSLPDLARFVVRKDQTLSVFGQSEETIRAFVHAAAGAGVDRIVPVGDALRFGRFWDGYDLLQELTRRVVARPG